MQHANNPEKIKNHLDMLVKKTLTAYSLCVLNILKTLLISLAFEDLPMVVMDWGPFNENTDLIKITVSPVDILRPNI